MGIFTRMRDILNANIHSILDKAENPEKTMRLMIQEMEDTLIEIKAQCAQAMAQQKTLKRQAADFASRAAEWGGKARLAVEKGREDLAREALMEKRRLRDRVEPLEGQVVEVDDLIDKYRNDITELEAKIRSVRDRQKVLVQRQVHAETKQRAEQRIRRASSVGVLTKFDQLEQKIDRLEAEADLVNYGTKPSLEEEFTALEADDDLEKELAALRKEVDGDKKEADVK